MSTSTPNVDDLTKDKVIDVPSSSASVDIIPDIGDVDPKQIQDFEKDINTKNIKSNNQNVNSPSFLSKIRKGLKISTSKTNKNLKEKGDSEIAESDDTTKSLLSDFIEKERESTVIHYLPATVENSSSEYPGYDKRPKTPVEGDKLIVLRNEEELDITGNVEPSTSFLQINRTGIVTTLKSRRVLRRTIIIDGIKCEVEEIIDEPEDGSPVKSITRKTIKNGQEVVENIIDPKEIEKILGVSMLNDNVRNTSERVTTTSTRKIIRRKIVVDGKESVVEEEVDVSDGDETTDKVILKSSNEGVEEVCQPENLDKTQKQFTIQTTISELPTDSNIITKSFTRKVIRRTVVVDGKEKVEEEVVEEPKGFGFTESFHREIQNVGDKSYELTTIPQEPQLKRDSEFINETQTDRTIFTTIKTRKLIRRIVIVDGKETVVEEEIDVPETSDNTDVLTSNRDNQRPIGLVEKPLKLDNVEVDKSQTISTRTIKKIRKIIKRITTVDGKEKVVEEIVDEPVDDNTIEIVKKSKDSNDFQLDNSADYNTTIIDNDKHSSEVSSETDCTTDKTSKQKDSVDLPTLSIPSVDIKTPSVTKAEVPSKTKEIDLPSVDIHEVKSPKLEIKDPKVDIKTTKFDLSDVKIPGFKTKKDKKSKSPTESATNVGESISVDIPSVTEPIVKVSTPEIGKTDISKIGVSTNIETPDVKIKKGKSPKGSTDINIDIKEKVSVDLPTVSIPSVDIKTPSVTKAEVPSKTKETDLPSVDIHEVKSPKLEIKDPKVDIKTTKFDLSDVKIPGFKTKKDKKSKSPTESATNVGESISVDIPSVTEPIVKVSTPEIGKTDISKIGVSTNIETPDVKIKKGKSPKGSTDINIDIKEKVSVDLPTVSIPSVDIKTPSVTKAEVPSKTKEIDLPSVDIHEVKSPKLEIKDPKVDIKTTKFDLSDVKIPGFKTKKDKKSKSPTESATNVGESISVDIPSVTEPIVKLSTPEIGKTDISKIGVSTNIETPDVKIKKGKSPKGSTDINIDIKEKVSVDLPTVSIPSVDIKTPSVTKAEVPSKTKEIDLPSVDIHEVKSPKLEIKDPKVDIKTTKFDLSDVKIPGFKTKKDKKSKSPTESATNVGESISVDIPSVTEPIVKVSTPEIGKTDISKIGVSTNIETPDVKIKKGKSPKGSTDINIDIKEKVSVDLPTVSIPSVDIKTPSVTKAEVPSKTKETDLPSVDIHEVKSPKLEIKDPKVDIKTTKFDLSDVKIPGFKTKKDKKSKSPTESATNVGESISVDIPSVTEPIVKVSTPEIGKTDISKIGVSTNIETPDVKIKKGKSPKGSTDINIDIKEKVSVDLPTVSIPSVDIKTPSVTKAEVPSKTKETDLPSVDIHEVKSPKLEIKDPKVDIKTTKFDLSDVKIPGFKTKKDKKSKSPTESATNVGETISVDIPSVTEPIVKVSTPEIGKTDISKIGVSTNIETPDVKIKKGKSPKGSTDINIDIKEKVSVDLPTVSIPSVDIKTPSVTKAEVPSKTKEIDLPSVDIHEVKSPKLEIKDPKVDIKTTKFDLSDVKIPGFKTKKDKKSKSPTESATNVGETISVDIPSVTEPIVKVSTPEIGKTDISKIGVSTNIETPDVKIKKGKSPKGSTDINIDIKEKVSVDLPTVSIPSVDIKTPSVTKAEVPSKTKETDLPSVDIHEVKSPKLEIKDPKVDIKTTKFDLSDVKIPGFKTKKDKKSKSPTESATNVGESISVDIPSVTEPIVKVSTPEIGKTDISKIGVSTNIETPDVKIKKGKSPKGSTDINIDIKEKVSVDLPTVSIPSVDIKTPSVTKAEVPSKTKETDLPSVDIHEVKSPKLEIKDPKVDIKTTKFDLSDVKIPGFKTKKDKKSKSPTESATNVGESISVDIPSVTEPIVKVSTPEIGKTDISKIGVSTNIETPDVKIKKGKSPKGSTDINIDIKEKVSVDLPTVSIPSVDIKTPSVTKAEVPSKTKETDLPSVDIHEVKSPKLEIKDPKVDIKTTKFDLSDVKIPGFKTKKDKKSKSPTESATNVGETISVDIPSVTEPIVKVSTPEIGKTDISKIGVSTNIETPDVKIKKGKSPKGSTDINIDIKEKVSVDLPTVSIPSVDIKTPSVTKAEVPSKTKETDLPSVDIHEVKSPKLEIKDPKVDIKTTKFDLSDVKIPGFKTKKDKKSKSPTESATNVGESISVDIPSVTEPIVKVSTPEIGKTDISKIGVSTNIETPDVKIKKGKSPKGSTDINIDIKEKVSVDLPTVSIPSVDIKTTSVTKAEVPSKTKETDLPSVDIHEVKSPKLEIKDPKVDIKTTKFDLSDVKIPGFKTKKDKKSKSPTESATNVGESISVDIPSVTEPIVKVSTPEIGKTDISKIGVSTNIETPDVKIKKGKSPKGSTDINIDIKEKVSVDLPTVSIPSVDIKTPSVTKAEVPSKTKETDLPSVDIHEVKSPKLEIKDPKVDIKTTKFDLSDVKIPGFKTKKDKKSKSPTESATNVGESISVDIPSVTEPIVKVSTPEIGKTDISKIGVSTNIETPDVKIKKGKSPKGSTDINIDIKEKVSVDLPTVSIPSVDIKTPSVTKAEVPSKTKETDLPSVDIHEVKSPKLEIKDPKVDIKTTKFDLSDVKIPGFKTKKDKKSKSPTESATYVGETISVDIPSVTEPIVKVSTPQIGKTDVSKIGVSTNFETPDIKTKIDKIPAVSIPLASIMSTSTPNVDDLTKDKVIDVPSSSASVDIIPDIGDVDPKQIQDFEKDINTKNIKSNNQNVNSPSFLSKIRKGLKISTSKTNKNLKEKGDSEIAESDDTTKSLLSDFIEKERESTVIHYLPATVENSSSEYPGYDKRPKTPVEGDKLIVLRNEEELDITGNVEPSTSFLQINRTGIVTTLKSRRVLRRTIIIDGIKCEVEEIIDEPEDGSPVKSITRKTIKNGQEVVENIIDPKEIEKILGLSMLNDNVRNTSERVTTTSTRKIIRRKIVVDGKESVVEEEVDVSDGDETTDKVILKSSNEGVEEVCQPENLDKTQKQFTIQTTISELPTDSNIITKSFTRKVIRRTVVVDGKEKIIVELDDPESDVSIGTDFHIFERDSCKLGSKSTSNRLESLDSVENSTLDSGSMKMVVKKVIGDRVRMKCMLDKVDDKLINIIPINLSDLSISSTYINGLKNNIIKSDIKNKYTMYLTFYEEIGELLDIITFYISKQKKFSDADMEFYLEEPLNSKQILNQIESVVKDVSNIKEKHTNTNEEYETIISIIEKLQNKTKLVKCHIDTFNKDVDLVDWQNQILRIDDAHKQIEQYKSDFEQLKKEKSSYQDKLNNLEILLAHNQLVIEELYDIISIYKIKYNSKNKLPDDTYKYLKAAIKLDKELENTTKLFIDEIEKDNFTNMNSKQLELVCGAVKNYNENTNKYYNIKHILEELDKYHHIATKLTNLKTLSESQKPDKNVIKHLDVELNNTQLNIKKLLTIQNEWTRIEDILTAEQKWLDEVGVSILDLTKITSINYVQTLSNTQNTITNVAMHYDKLIYLKDIIEKLQNQIDVKPLLYVCEQHTNDTFKLKNNLKAKEMRLITFKKQYDKYSELKNNIELSLLRITSNLEDITPSQEIVDNNIIGYELEILEESIRTCSDSLNESLDILPISDGQNEIETMGSFTTECKALKDKLYKTRSTVDNREISKIFKHLETALEKPKDTLLDHIKTLKGISYEIIAIENLENNDQQLSAFKSQCNSQLKDYSDLNKKTEILRNTLFELTNDIKNADFTLSELENESHKDRHTSETAICKTYHQISDQMKNMQQMLSSTSQQLKQLKDSLKHFKKDRKTLESEVNEVEKRYKQLKTKHQSALKTFENKCNYWTMVDDLLLKIIIKNNHVNNLTIIPSDSDTLAGKHLEAILKHLKDVRSLYDKENKTILADVETLRRKGDKDQIDEIIDGDLKQWNDTGVAVKQLVERYEKASKTLHSYQQLRESTNNWLNNKLLSIETTEDVSDKTKSIDKQKENLVELRKMITDVAETIGLNLDDAPLNEIEELSLKLEKVQKVLAALGDVADKKNKMSDNIEDAKRLLHDIEKNSSKSTKNNDENLKELRMKLLDLNKSKKEMDESFDIDNFEIPLCEKRTYSIIEVFQLWQQIFKETFNQYRKLSCSLLENENNIAVFELWHDYLMYVQEFLKSPVPGDYHSLTSHERLCQVHQEVLISQMDTIPNCMNKPDIISEPEAMERFTSLMDLHNATMTELESTHQEVWTKLGHWKEYRTNVKKVYEWLWKVEKVHSNLNLKFINTRRLPQLKSQITSLLNNLAVERSQINDLENRQNTIFEFCDKPTETGYRKELIAISQRVNEIQASLEVWNGYLENIEKLTTSFDVQSTEIDQVLQNVQTKLDTLKNEFGSNEDIVPSDKLKIESNKIQELNNSLKQLDPQLSSTADIRDKLKDSLDPIEIRSFGQKLRFLIYHQKDLQYQLFLYSCQIDNLLYKPQEFTHRYTRFRNWAIDTETQLKNLTKSLKDPQFAIDVLKPEFESQINSKQKEFNWLNGAGNQLIKAESQLNPQLVKTTESNLKEINENWNSLNGSLYKYTVELPTTILNTNKLFDKLNTFKIWINDLESKINNAIVFNDRSEYNLKEELKSLDALSNAYKEKQGEYNELMARCNEQLENDKNTNDSDTTQDLQCPSKTLPISWKNLENKISDKRVRVLSAWEELQTILGLVDVETKWLSRLNVDVEEHKKKKFVEHKSLSGLISNFEQEQKNAKDKFSKLELAVSISRSTYTAKFIDEEIEIISKKRESLLEQIDMILIILKKSLTLWKDFINAHGRAVVTLTQVDTKLIQLELLDKSDNGEEGNARVMEKNLGNLQILEMELKKYGGLLEKADALGLQLMTNSTPSDIKNIQEMIDEYQLLWKDINNRIEKLKVTCVQETSCRKKRSVNEEVQVETLKFGKDSQIQVDTLPTELLRKDSFQYELQTAIANATTNLNDLELAIQKSDKNLSKNIATCQMSIDLIKHLSVILKTQCGVSESDITIIRSEELLAKYEELLVNFRSQQQVGQPKTSNSAMCPLCSEQNWSQFENDMWRLEHWIQSTEAKLSVQPMVPPSKIEQLEDVIQEHRELLLYLDSHRNIVQSLNVIGHHLAEHSNDEERAAQIKNRLSATNSRWDRVCFACTEWQTKLQTALMENDEFYGVIDELVDWLDETERAIKTTEPVDLAEDTVIIVDKFNKFKNMHAELERCEPRVVSLLEAADWLRQANEKTGATTRSTSAATSATDQTIVDSHARLSHLRARLTVLINMTASYATKLGTTLGYDMSPDSVCIRLHQVDDTSTAMNRSDEEEPNTNVGGDETVLRRGYRFFGRVMRASLPFQVLMLLVLGAASLVPIVDEEFSCMESNNIAWSLYPLLRYPGGPPPV
ncbi:uncharacterized protein LOC113552228 [Rhopalosiphum maidis]|uniref:uncharacterized protein LOC113552228 n=1 Tax=Rhopalosiphum maidis TaxID=43146 RepID=UPI000EFF8266|nr:uncharacterized protein LOC113552228 [Rhopalosiphum maidis]